jgi:hypothetical protein
MQHADDPEQETGMKENNRGPADDRQDIEDEIEQRRDRLALR